MAVTKQKGSLAEAKVLSCLVEKGYNVFVPWGEDHRFDLVCERNGHFKRIQVKYVTPKNGGLDVPLRSMNNWSMVRYSPANIDIIAVYDPKGDKSYFISINDFANIATIKLRFEKPKNSQRKLVKWARDFEEMPT